MASSPTRPEVAILCHSPALNALKRPQLVALAKEFGLKASGKNAELIERLKQHGQELVRKPRVSAAPPDQEAGQETSWMVLDEHEDTNEPDNLASNQETDVEMGMQEFGVDADCDKSTIPTSSSSSSLASTIRSVGGSLLRKLKSTTNLAKSSSQSSLATLATPSGPTQADPSSLASPVRPSTPKIYPSLTPESIASYSLFALGAQGHAMTEATPETQNNQHDSSFSTFSTMTTSSCTSSFQAGAGIRLVSRPTEYGAASSTTTLPLPAATSTPSPENVEPSFTSDRERDFTFVTIPQGTTHVTTLAPVSPELSKPSTGDARFIFGSPLPKAKSAFTFSLSPGPSIEPLLAPPTIIAQIETSTTTGVSGGLVRSKSTTELVMEEMNRRALESLAQSSTLNQSISSLSHSTSTHRLQSGSNAKDKKRMFEASHRKVFDRMQGIDTHYAAKRPREATTNNTLSASTSTSLSMFRSTSSKALFHRGGEEDETSRSSKKPKLASSTLGQSMRSKRLFGAGTSTLASNPMGKQSPEKVTSALREQGWLSVSSGRSGTTSGTSTLKESSRNGKKEQSPEEREEVKRRLGMLKHQRRKSQAQQATAGMRKKRVSLGPTPKPGGSLTKNLFRATFGSKAPTNGAPPVPSSIARPPPAPIVPTVLARSTAANYVRASMSSLSRPKPSHAASSIGTTRPKFDLQASLKRKPVGYIPKLGPLSTSEPPPSHKLDSPASARPSSSNLFAPTLASSSKQLPPSTRVLGSSVKANVASLQTNSPTVVRKADLLQGKLGGRVQPSLAGGRGGALGASSARASAIVAPPKVE